MRPQIYGFNNAAHTQCVCTQLNIGFEVISAFGLDFATKHRQLNDFINCYVVQFANKNENKRIQRAH